ncbi:unnamed protein product [Cuscuta campestris]|uniref:Uncharacterized protein n=1 Tax=Cuscuta campestris TaxID=132261 RepID=A0A484LB72_9ASTE|nr:unnamed protein product [Cuscuta campestris]
MGPSSSSSSSSLIGSYAAFFFIVMLFIGGSSSDKMVGAEAPSGCDPGGTHGACTNDGERGLCDALCRALPEGHFKGGQCSPDSLCVCICLS